MWNNIPFDVLLFLIERSDYLIIIFYDQFYPIIFYKFIKSIIS